MRKAKFSIVFIAISLLALSVSAQSQSGVLGVWRDINPTAYLNPPNNPPLRSVYMLSASEGWAVGDYRTPLVGVMDGLHASPAVLHYDGATWNLVPVPKNPTDPNIAAGYVLTSVNFGPPGRPISRNDGWAVGIAFDAAGAGPCGGGGALTCAIALHWDGVTWREQLSGLTGPDAGPLESVFMVSATDAWAVGSNVAGAAGRFWHWTGVPGLGGGWSLQGSVATPLNSVFMVSATEGWAVGAGGAIYHYFGGSWTAVPSPVATTLISVFMLSPTDGWAVGVGGTILHYTGGVWTGPVSPGTTINDLQEVFMISASEGWAVGTAGTFVHYSGGTWTALPVNQVPTIPATAFEFSSVFMNTASDAWAVGTAGEILHYDGVNWGTVTSPTLTELTSISFGPPLTGPFNPNDGWAVGRATSSLIGPPPPPPLTTEPTIIHWNGFMWTKGVAIGATNDLYAVFMLSSGDVWAVGGGTDPTATCVGPICPVILHFTGGSWNTVTPPPGSYILSSVFMVSPTEGWAVGCSGTPDQCVTMPRAPGGSGIILHYTVTGGVGSWAIFPAPVTPVPLPPLNSVFMLGPNEGWAVGDSGAVPGGTVLHYTVTGGVGTWSVVTVTALPVGANLNSVFMLSRTSGWAVGGILPPGPPAGPVIIYWDGTHWTLVSTPTVPGGPLASPPTLRSIYCPASNDCWAVGNIGDPLQLVVTIFHWDGIAWTHITLAPSLLGLPMIPPNLNSVYMISRSEGWIVGSSPIFSAPPVPVAASPPSTILRFAPFGGILTATSTTTVVSTVSTSTTHVATSTTTTSTSILYTSTTTTVTQTATTTPGGIPGFPVESIIAGITIGLVTLTVLRRRRLRDAGG